MQLIAYFIIWLLSLVGIILLLWSASRKANNEEGDLHKQKEGSLGAVFFDTLLVSEVYLKKLKRKIVHEFKDYNFSDLKEFITQQIPVQFIQKKFGIVFRGSDRYERRGEASHFLKKISEHKDMVRKNGNGESEFDNKEE